MPPLVIAVAISMKDVLVNFGPPFGIGLGLMAVLALAFPAEIASAALGGAASRGALSAVAGMLGLAPLSSDGSVARRVALAAETAASLPAILLAGTLAPAVAAIRFLMGLVLAWGIGRSMAAEPSSETVDASVAPSLWKRVTAVSSQLLDRYGNSLILAAVVAGAIGFLIPDATVATILGGRHLYAPAVAVLLAVVTPARGGAEVVVAATLLAKGAGVPAVLTLVLSAPLLNLWTFRRLFGSLPARASALVWSTIAAAAAIVGPVGALLPGFQRL